MFHTKSITFVNIISKQYVTKNVTGTLVKFSDELVESNPTFQKHRSYRSDEIDKKDICVHHCDFIKIQFNNNTNIHGHWMALNQYRTTLWWNSFYMTYLLK